MVKFIFTRILGKNILFFKVFALQNYILKDKSSFGNFLLVTINLIFGNFLRSRSEVIDVIQRESGKTNSSEQNEEEPGNERHEGDAVYWEADVNF